MNAAGGNWETASNWSTGALPGPADDVVISGLGSGAAVTHASDNTSIHSLTVSASTGNFFMAGGTLTLGSSSSFSIPLTFTNGTISGPGDLTLASTAALNWTGGVMKGAGQTIANGGLTLSGGGTKTLDGRTLTIPANENAMVDGGSFYGYNGAVLNNNGTFHVLGDPYFGASGNTPTSNNNGTLVKSPTTGTTYMYWAFNSPNSSTVLQQSGTLVLDGGGSEGGSFTVAANSTLILGGGTHVFQSTSSITGGGTVTLQGGNVELGGSYNLGAGAATVVNGASVDAPGTVASVGDTLSISSGAINFRTANITVPTLNLSGGGLHGAGDVGVTNLTWTGGTMADAGSTTVANNGVLSISGAGSKTLDARGLLISPGVTGPGSPAGPIWTGGTIYGQNGAIIANYTTFDMGSDDQLYAYTGDTPLFYNYGSVRKLNTTGTTSVGWQFQNAGTVDVESGTVSFTGGGYSSITTAPGTFTVAGALTFAGGNFYLSGNTTVSGAGSVDFHGGNVEVAGAYNITGSTTISGANVSFPGAVTSVGSPLTISGGVADFRANNISATAGTMSGGHLRGTGNVQFTFLTWSGGAMEDTGTTTVGAPGHLSIEGSGSKTLDRRTLNLPGTTTDWDDGTIYGQDGAVINNTGSSDFAIHNGQQLYAYSGDTPVFNNQAAVHKDSTGAATISWQFNNSVFTEVDNGTLNLTGGGTSSGNFVSVLTIGSSGSKLMFGGGTYNLTGSSSIAGFNAVEFSGGNVEMAGTYNVNGTPASTTVSGATVHFVGTTTSIGSTLTVSGGEADFISPIGGGGPVSLDSLTLSNGILNLFANAVTTPVFAQSGGLLMGTADVNTAKLTWTGGTMGDTGSTTVAPNGILSMSGAASKTLDTRTLTISTGVTGPVTPPNPPDPIWTGGTIYGSNGAVINNTTTFDVGVADQQLYSYTGDTPIFNNFGTFLKRASTGTTTVGWAFNNLNNNTDGMTTGGAVTVQGGTLVLHGGASQGADSPDQSQIIVALGANLRFDSDYFSLGGFSSLSGAGAVDFHGGNVEMAGNYNITGSTVVSGATVSFPGTLTNLGGSFTLSGGQADFETNSVTVANASISGGTLLGTNNVTFTNLTWEGGAIQNTATTAVTGSTLLIGGGGNKFLIGGVLSLAGSTSWVGNTIYGADGAVIDNFSDFVIQGDQQLFWYSGDTPRFNNHSSLRKTSGAGTATIGWRLVNVGGSVQVQSGTLALNAGGYSNSGILSPASFTVASACTLSFGGDDYELGAGTTVSGAGNVVFSAGAIDVTDTYNVTGSSTVSGATVRFLPPGTLTSVGSTFTLSGGQVDFGDHNLTIATGVISGTAWLFGTGAVNFTNLTWTGGALWDAGTTTVSGSLTISGTGTKTLINRTLVLNCNTNWSGGIIYGYDGAVINNQAGFTFTDATDQPLYWGGGATPIFNNSGAFQKTGGSGAQIVYWAFNNASGGSTSVGAATLSLSGGVSQGSFTVAVAANLTFGSGSYQLGAGSSVSGAGGVSVSGSTTLDAFGTYNLTGTTTVGSGAMLEFYSNAGTASLSNAGTVVIGNGVTLTLTGSYNQTSGGVTDLFAGVIAAGGGVTIGANSSFFGLGTINGNLTDSGTLSLGFGSSTGILTVNGNYTQTSTGTLNIKIGGTTAGTQFDQLAVAGTGNTATLAGTLNVSVINGFSPPVGSTYLILLFPSRTGSFLPANVSPFTMAYEAGDVKLTR
jgi:hypothetical protein